MWKHFKKEQQKTFHLTNTVYAKGAAALFTIHGDVSEFVDCIDVTMYGQRIFAKKNKEQHSAKVK